MGRPTEDKKETRLQFRLSETDMKMLDCCCQVYELTKAEVIRQGIKEMYEKAMEK